MGIAAPLILGSHWAAAIIPLMFVLLVMRITHEERFLRARLAGYDAYVASTPSRLVPGIW